MTIVPPLLQAPTAPPRLFQVALGLSLAVHGALLWLPRASLPQHQEAPPLQATLYMAAPRMQAPSQPAAAHSATPATTIGPRQTEHPPAPSRLPAKLPMNTPMARPASRSPSPPLLPPAPGATLTAAPAIPATSGADSRATGITEALALDRAPTGTAVTPLPSSVAEPDPNALERYGRALSSLLERQQQYPRLAAMRGWEGEVRLQVSIARKGAIVAIQIAHSSGFDVLDRHAMELVQGTAPLPPLPEALRDRDFQLIIPIHYKLQRHA